MQVDSSYLTKHGPKYLDQVLNCHFLPYVEKATSTGIDAFELYLRTWKCRIFDPRHHDCKSKPLSDFEAKCEARKYTGAKIISLPSNQALFDLLENGVKVIHLVRDPRSTWLSRTKVKVLKDQQSLQDFFSSNTEDIVRKAATKSHTDCENLTDDLERLEALAKTRLSQNYRLVRFEDVALEPKALAAAMYEFLHIPVHRRVLQWVDKNTHQSSE